MDESSLRTKMQDVVDLVASDAGSIRTGRATSGLVDDLVIDAYGGTQKLKVKELATISVPDAQTIILDPWDKSIIGDIRKGVSLANIGLNPVIDGEIIRISLPPLTTEDREKFIKLLSTKLESGKVMIRQIRGEEMRNIRDSFDKKEISEDEKFDLEKKVQSITDEYTGKIEEIGKVKKQELQQI
ncbi:ribosome recycling factor [Patescibacteria group bacterium]